MRIGLLGCGIVGGAFVELLNERRAAIAATSGLELELARVAVRSITKERAGNLDPALLTTDAQSVVDDPTIDLVVEVIGGIEPARSLIQSALRSGKSVVTGNKELLANVGADLYAAADAAGVDLLFEAAVAGAIPVVRPLRESLLGEDVTRLLGIVNGTTNYILTRMSTDGVSYAEALAEAQHLGYAERDPTADVEGYDAGAKAAILASIAFGEQVVAGDVYHEGIAGLTDADIDYAHRLGYEIKLLAIAEAFPPVAGTGADGAGSTVRREIGVRVHPAMVPVDHPLAAVRDSFNAVFVEGTAAGELMFYGRGAGGRPTASAVLGDVVDAAANRLRGHHRPVPTGARAKIRSIDDLASAYYVNLEVTDAPGVLAAVAGVFGTHGVSIRSMEQQGLGNGARIAFITHRAIERNLRATLADLRRLDVVAGIGSVLRVVGE
ncbi:MAG: homoserine dehydrogenase [Acidimicrobiia bacterium]|nr:homoserine dehydrogenase [Acidimicrobiia bacterium]MDH4363774.1 homoserine dehydrogenase [Acidimicrobiia bacterium]